ncbi:MAG: hypothetical protein WDO15_16620 [Bacteroidota bacterium]
MKRRKFIKIGIGLSVVALVALLFPSFGQAIKRILRQDTDDLQVNDDAIDQYVEDARKERFLDTFSLTKKVLIIVHTYFGFLGGLIPYRNKYVQYRGQITGHFLLSTDHFRNRMDVTKPVEYTGFYNPYRQPCSNPFSTIFYPETA